MTNDIPRLEARIQALEKTAHTLRGLVNSLSSANQTKNLTNLSALSNELKHILNWGFVWLGIKVNIKLQGTPGLSLDATGLAALLKPYGGLDKDITGLFVPNNSATAFYNGGVISLGLVDDAAAWADVDATNAKITATISKTGNYLVMFTFPWTVNFTDVAVGTNLGCAFRITDGVANSPANEVCLFNKVVAPVVEQATLPVLVLGIFNYALTGAKTWKLQKTTFLNAGTVTTNEISSDNTRGRALNMGVMAI